MPRKGGYGINGMIICDHRARVIAIRIGWPGSVHDNRIYSNMEQCLFPDKFFTTSQYLLGDSAFQASNHMVPCFKKPIGCPMPPIMCKFNTVAAKPRARSEHCIGMIKGRFQHLRGIRTLIRDKESCKTAVRRVYCGAMLHNILLSYDYDEDWTEEEIEIDAVSASDVDLTSSDPDQDKRTMVMDYLFQNGYLL